MKTNSIHKTLLLFVLITINLACSNQNLESFVTKKRPSNESVFTEMLELDMINSDFYLSYESNYYQRVVITGDKKGMKGIVISRIEEPRYKRRSIDSEIRNIKHIYDIQELPDSVVSNIHSDFSFLDEVSFITDTLIERYNHNWLDCTSDEFIIKNKEGLSRLFYHCLDRQETSNIDVKNAVDLRNVFSRNIDLTIYKNALINKLKKGKFYSLGHIQLYIWNDDDYESWLQKAPQRQYQKDISDSITNLLSIELNNIYSERIASYSDIVNEYCYDSYTVKFDKSIRRWLIVGDREYQSQGRDYRRCKKVINELLELCKFDYDLLYEETRIVDIYRDTVEVIDDNWYGNE